MNNNLNDHISTLLNEAASHRALTAVEMKIRAALALAETAAAQPVHDDHARLAPELVKLLAYLDVNDEDDNYSRGEAAADIRAALRRACGCERGAPIHARRCPERLARTAEPESDKQQADYRAALAKIADIEYEAGLEIAEIANDPKTSSNYLLIAQRANAALEKIGNVILDTDDSLYDELDAALEGPVDQATIDTVEQISTHISDCSCIHFIPVDESEDNGW